MKTKNNYFSKGDIIEARGGWIGVVLCDFKEKETLNGESIKVLYFIDCDNKERLLFCHDDIDAIFLASTKTSKTYSEVYCKIKDLTIDFKEYGEICFNKKLIEAEFALDILDDKIKDYTQPTFFEQLLSENMDKTIEFVLKTSGEIVFSCYI